MEPTRKQVIDNLRLLRDNLFDLREGKRSDRGTLQGRTYRVMMNKKTGGFRFPESINTLGSMISRPGNPKSSPSDWKEIQIKVKDETVGIHFEIADNRGAPIELNDLEPLARTIAKETLNLLNQKGKQVPHITGKMLPEEYALRDLSTSGIEQLEGWHGAATRINAELLLSKWPVGTYLLREPERVTLWSSSLLEKENHVRLHTYILTVVEDQKKISDYQIIETDKGWTFYRDNPDIGDEKNTIYVFHPTVQSLLESFKDVAKTPLKRSL